MKRVEVAPATILHPHPVLLVGSYGQDGKPNLMNAAWGGICCSDPPCVSVSLREATLTYHNILQWKAFTIGIPSRAQVEIADYVGVVSGRDRDKFADTGLTAVKSEKVAAPVAAELPYTLECRLLKHDKLGLHTIFIGEILGISADEAVLGARGMPDIEKVQAILYGGFGSNSYYAIGDNLGRAFGVGKALRPKQG
jgi:flavin reductase (DIM6/NTAB) family NADH-FMN oxidoreductase RutF